MTAELDPERLAGSLQRIEDLVTTLDGLSHTGAREPARELMETLLDLYGLALTRVVALVAQSGEGPALLGRFAQDAQISAVLLLHGLHPEAMEARVRKTVEHLTPGMARRGMSLDLVAVLGGKAKLRLRAGEGGGDGIAALRREIEAALTEAAPDLDEIEIEDWRVRDAVSLPAADVAAVAG